MFLSKKDHDKLVENFKLIVDYLKNNVASKIIDNINFQFNSLNGPIEITISPIIDQLNTKCWFTIKKGNTYFTADGYLHTFYTNGKEGVGFDLFDGYNDCILYEFIDNWNFVIERCEICIKASEEAKNKINNFSI